MQQRGLALEQVEQAAQVVHVGRQVGDAEQVFLARQYIGLLLFGQRLAAGRDSRLGERDDVLLQRFEFVVDAPANLVELDTRIVFIDEVGSLDQLRLRIALVGHQHAVLHVAIRGHDDDQDALFREAQKFDMAEGSLALRCHHHAGKLRQFGEHLRGRSDHALRLIGQQVLAHFVARHIVKRLHREQGIDKQAVAARRGDAPGRGVRAGDEAEVFEIGHHVADGRRREVEAGEF